MALHQSLCLSLLIDYLKPLGRFNMTIITAARQNEIYTMACDTMHNCGYTKIMAKDDNEKVVYAQESFIGFAGNVVNRLAITEAIKKTKACFESVKATYLSMLRIHKLLKSDYFLTSQATIDDPFEDSASSILICNKHGIFRVGSDNSVIRHDHFWAIGSGMHFGLGAMYSFINDPDSATNVVDIVWRGVEAAIEFSDSCGGKPVAMYRNFNSDLDEMVTVT